MPYMWIDSLLRAPVAHLLHEEAVISSADVFCLECSGFGPRVGQGPPHTDPGCRGSAINPPGKLRGLRCSQGPGRVGTAQGLEKEPAVCSRATESPGAVSRGQCAAPLPPLLHPWPTQPLQPHPRPCCPSQDHPQDSAPPSVRSLPCMHGPHHTLPMGPQPRFRCALSSALCGAAALLPSRWKGSLRKEIRPGRSVDTIPGMCT